VKFAISFYYVRVAILLSIFEIKFENTHDCQPEIIKMLRLSVKKTSVADPDPGSGIRCLFDPWIQNRFFRIRDKHPGSATLKKTNSWKIFGVTFRNYNLKIFVQSRAGIFKLLRSPEIDESTPSSM
jgi:hypothetical protein